MAQRSEAQAVVEPMTHDRFVEEFQQGHLECLEQPAVWNRTAEGVGPTKALNKLGLKEKSRAEKLAWMAEVKICLRVLCRLVAIVAMLVQGEADRQTWVHAL